MPGSKLVTSLSIIEEAKKEGMDLYVIEYLLEEAEKRGMDLSEAFEKWRSLQKEKKKK